MKPKTVKVQSQCARVTLVGKSVRTNHNFRSLILNLAYEGLLLGLWGGDHREAPMKLHLTQPTFITIATVNILACFAEMGSLAQRWNLHHYRNYPHLQHPFMQGATVLLNSEAQARSEVQWVVAGVEPIGVPEITGEHKSPEVPWKGAAKQWTRVDL
jgi:hypothetical protein